MRINGPKLIIGVMLAGVAVCGGCKRPAPSETGSTSTDAEQPPAASKGIIAVSVLTQTNPFFNVIVDNIKAEAAKNGYETLITSGEFNVARQQDQVKDFIVKKVSAIVLCPCDSMSIAPAIKEANEAGIPVFTADIACMAKDVEVVSHIATDNFGGGREAAKAMIEVLGGKGKVAILDFPLVESVIMRTEGFEAEIAEQNKKPEVDIEIVAKLPGDGVRDKGFKATQDLLQAHPGINGIFAINDPSGLGARAALEKAGKADQVIIIAFDGQPEGKQAIKDGKIYADPIQFPDKIGRETVRAIVKHFEGEKIPPEILIPTSLYRKSDAEKDPELN